MGVEKLVYKNNKHKKQQIMNKNKKFQKQQLVDQGYENFKEFYLNPLS